jgi:hypothetical protein
MLALTSPTSGGRSVGIVRSQAQAMEFLYMEGCCLSSRKISHVYNFLKYFRECHWQRNWSVVEYAGIFTLSVHYFQFLNI